MNPNPYQSPVIPPNAGSTSPATSEESTHQVLVDMRNMQREMLTMTKDAVERQKRTVRWMLLGLAGFILFGMLLLVVFTYLSLLVEFPVTPAAPARFGP
jgi:hypothetical protein